MNYQLLIVKVSTYITDVSRRHFVQFHRASATESTNKMDVGQSLKYNILIFKICGLWEVKSHKNCYRTYSILFVATIFFIFPASLAMNLFFVDSVDDIIKHSFLAINIAMLSMKAIALLRQRSHLKLLICTLEEIEFHSQISKNDSLFEYTQRDCKNLVRAFVCCYLSTMLCVAVLAVFSAPEDRFWSSTLLIPVESFHHPAIYYGGLIYQMCSTACVCFVAASLDTFGVALMHISRCLFHALGNHLQNAGRHGSNKENERDLINICEQYEKMIR